MEKLLLLIIPLTLIFAYCVIWGIVYVFGKIFRWSEKEQSDIVVSIFFLSIIVALGYGGYLLISFIVTSPLIFLILMNIAGIVLGILIAIVIGGCCTSSNAVEQSFLFMTILAIILNCMYIRTYFFG